MANNGAEYMETYKERANRIINMPMKDFHEKYGGDVKAAYDVIRKKEGGISLLKSLGYLETVFSDGEK